MASSFSDIDFDFDIDIGIALRFLLSCAEAIEDGDLKSADSFLQNILILADKRPYLNESKVVKYFADALVRRAYGLHPAPSFFTFPVDPAPYYRYDSDRINGVIKKVIYDALMGNRRLHLIDLSIPDHFFAGSVLLTLPTFSGDPLPVRVSYVVPPFLKKYADFSDEMEFVTRDAEEVNVKLEDELKVVYGNSLAEVDEWEIDLKRRRDDEMVVVYYKFKLHKLVRDAKAMERELVRLKELNPTIVILLDFYSNHTHPNFLTCFKDSFQFYFNTCTFLRQSTGIDFDSYQWEYNRDASEGNSIIRRHQTLREWQRLFSMAGFTRIPLSREKHDLIDGFSMVGLEIMREEEECLILGDEGCPLFFLSAWKPKVGDGHFNSISTNHKFGEGLNPNPPPLQPLQPFLQGLTLNQLAAVAEIHDISKYLYCKYNLSLALTSTSKVNNMNETMWGPNKKFTFFIQSNFCYVKDFESYEIMSDVLERINSLIIEKAFESGDGYHFEPSITKLDLEFYQYSRLKKCNIDVVVAICLQNRHTSNEVHIVEFFWPATEIEKSKSLALDILNDLKRMKTRFVTVKVQGTEIKFQEEAISSIPTSSNTAMPLKIAEEARDIHAIEINGHIEQIVETKRNKQRKSWSKVWEDFDKFEEDGKQVAKCKHCPRVLTGSSKSGTTHLKNHSKVCPGKKKKKNQENQLILPVDTNERCSTFDQERSHLDLVKMVIKHQYPLDLAGQEAFKNFVKGLQPMYEFQSRDKLLSDIHRIYNEEREKLQLYFDQLACKLNLIVGLWKNNHGKNAYCCLIAHFIDDGWELKMKTLGLRTLEHINDAKAVGGIILSLVSEWNIGSKVCSITVDNSFLDDSMVQQIKEDLVSLSSTHWFINCTLLEDGFREMDDLLFNLKKSIEYVTETKPGRLKFQEAVDQVKLQDGKSWDDLSFKLESDFGVLDSALRSIEFFCKLEQIDGNFKLNPSMEEWKNAEALQSCLRCFDDIKGTQSLNVSFYVPKLCHIYMKFLQLENSNPSFVTLMKRRFDHYWSLCNSALAVASVLDPRLKFKFVEFSNILIYGHDSKVQLNTFREVLTNVYNEYANETQNQTTSASVLDDINWLGNNSIWDSFSKFVTASNFNEASSMSELELYLDEPLVPKDEAVFDILGWWCDKSQKFPILAKMARDFLAIPVSIFTPCSNIKATINNPAYNILNPESMEALACCENWLETPEGNDGENQEPTQTTDKGKRKLDEDTCVRKKSKPSNGEKAIRTEDISKDSNNSEFNHGRNSKDVNEISSGDSSSDNDQSDQVQSSSSESDDETTLKEQGQWCEQDVRVYLVSNFTNKDYEQLDKLERKKLNRKSIGQDKELDLTGDKLEPLLMVPRSTETPKNYHINEVVINAFFKLLKKRSHKFPKAFISHYSFDSQAANLLIKGSRSDQEVLARYKPDHLSGVRKLFLPLCLSDHWVLFYVDINAKKFSCLDPYQSSGILSFNSNNIDKILQWFKSFLLPEFGYKGANEWPYVVRNDIPQQKNSVDCGVFVMKYGDCLTYGDFFPFTQKDMIHFRRRIFLDLYRGRLHIENKQD